MEGKLRLRETFVGEAKTVQEFAKSKGYTVHYFNKKADGIMAPVFPEHRVYMPDGTFVTLPHVYCSLFNENGDPYPRNEKPFKVNFAALGSVSVENAIRYAELIKEAAELAKWLNENVDLLAEIVEEQYTMLVRE